MRLRLLFFLALLLPCGGKMAACSCGSFVPTFCQFIRPGLAGESTQHIFTATTLAYREASLGRPVLDILIMEVFQGDDLFVGDTISMVLQDGLNCNAFIREDLVAEAYMFAMSPVNEETGPGFWYPSYFLSGCGVSFLPFRKQTLFGAVAPGKDSLGLEAFLSDEEFCFSAPAFEPCECAVVYDDFCDFARRMDEQQDNLNIARVENIYSNISLPLYDVAGNRGRMKYVSVLEVLLGNEVAVGDTIAHILSFSGSCLTNEVTRDNFITMFRELDRTGGLETPEIQLRASEYPLVRTPDCGRSIVEIRFGMVQPNDSTEFTYAEYLEELRVCIPTLSADELRATLGMMIYPNPTSGLLNLQPANAQSIQTVSLYDMAGRQVQEHFFDRLQPVYSLGLTGLPSGVYQAVVTTERGAVAYRVVKR